MKKKKEKDAPGGCSVAPRVDKRKGRGVMKKGDNPPLAVC
jgi:hypothetical protein